MGKFIISAFADEISADLAVQIEILKKHRIRFMELRSIGGKNVAEFTPDEMREVKKELDRAGIAVSAIGSPIGKCKIDDDFEEEIEKFKNIIELAHILDTHYIRMFSFVLPEENDPAIYRDEVLRRWRRYVDVAKGSGLILLHENEKNIYGDTAVRCLDLIKNMASSVVLATFDPANFVQCGEKVFPDAFNVMDSYIGYVHIKDASIKEGINVPAGEGDGQISEVLSALKERDLFISLEPHLALFEGFANLEQGEESLAEGDRIASFATAVNALRKIMKDIGAKEG
ncbi:MAG: sugar phosphate isomerase/epimerase [Clostridia bacterium]|nr:sugar phosphate isomerase/epimerase [Clostridia bacterium]